MACGLPRRPQDRPSGCKRVQAVLPPRPGPGVCLSRAVGGCTSPAPPFPGGRQPSGSRIPENIPLELGCNSRIRLTRSYCAAPSGAKTSSRAEADAGVISGLQLEPYASPADRPIGLIRDCLFLAGGILCLPLRQMSRILLSHGASRCPASEAGTDAQWLRGREDDVCMQG